MNIGCSWQNAGGCYGYYTVTQNNITPSVAFQPLALVGYGFIWGESGTATCSISVTFSPLTFDLSGNVWEDVDLSGKMDSGEEKVTSGVTITAYKCIAAGSKIVKIFTSDYKSTSVGSNGSWSLTGLSTMLTSSEASTTITDSSGVSYTCENLLYNNYQDSEGGYYRVAWVVYADYNESNYAATEYLLDYLETESNGKTGVRAVYSKIIHEYTGDENPWSKTSVFYDAGTSVFNGYAYTYYTDSSGTYGFAYPFQANAQDGAAYANNSNYRSSNTTYLSEVNLRISSKYHFKWYSME